MIKINFFFKNIVLLVLLMLITSCSGMQGKLKMALGNFYFSRGMYVEAIGSYMDALKYPDEAAFANYAIGSAYLAMEQSSAALGRFKAAEEKAVRDGKRELIYRIRYNSGVVHFKSGDMLAAADSFKRALEADGSRVNAKLNLELSMLSLLRQNETAQIKNTVEGSVHEDNERRKQEILFDFIRKKESDKWKSLEWPGEEDETGLDY
ncbi:MAG: tetratricopeptide repeat protein [Spirochaetaceae bacterium]|jgi:Ca-activated chloride channel family protein|nr:tetratricopeptide repeat protein [Spirochaetaceae bacterium]